MQLFITPYQQEKKLLIIREERVVSQCVKVLRYSPWSEFFVQSSQGRKKVILQRIEKNSLYTNIIKSYDIPVLWNHLTMAIAVPNKIDKLELIVQKLWEIWVHSIIVRSAVRSQLKEIPEKKIQRLQSILCEAVEQSWGRHMPELKVVSRLWWTIENKEIVVFDITSAQHHNASLIQQNHALMGIIGPEWWLDDRDYKEFWNNYSIESLGETILRMETAAIIAAWKLKHAL
jgi:RsmE family RNA methyltransferase